MDKQRRSAEQLRAMVQVRLNAQPEVQRRSTEEGGLPIVGLPRKHAPDFLGRSWDITELQRGTGLVATFRTIVNSMRDAYDLE